VLILVGGATGDAVRTAQDQSPSPGRILKSFEFRKLKPGSLLVAMLMSPGDSVPVICPVDGSYVLFLKKQLAINKLRNGKFFFTDTPPDYVGIVCERE
jgi:hypothetical protein